MNQKTMFASNRFSCGIPILRYKRTICFIESPFPIEDIADALLGIRELF